MPKYDIETLLSEVKAILVANLNTQIAAVEAEKVAAGAPATNLKPVDVTDGYFEQSWSDKILNINPAIFYGVEQIQAIGTGPATGEVIKVFVEIVAVDTQEDVLMGRRINRYSRAIKEVLEANYDKLSFGNKMKIETVRPISWRLDADTSEEVRVGGVSLITAIA